MAPNALALALTSLMVFVNPFPSGFLAALKTQTPPSVQLNPSTLKFGKQVIRKPSVAKRITITNVGGTPLYVNSATISGDNWKDFNISKDGCSEKQLGPGKSCLIAVIFTPRHIEDHNATLVLTDNASDSPQNVSLTGTGINAVDVPPF
jgi:hypothetical protein